MKKEIPFLAVSNEEIANNPPVGKKATCPHCKKKHKVEYGKDGKTKEISRLLGFVDCGEKTYLVSLAGKLL